MTERTEIWLPVLGYEDRYAVSDQGRVRSLLSGRLLSPILINSGYLSVHLHCLGKRQPWLVHRLVAVHFLGHPEDPSWEVNHLDYDRLNNAAINLAWVSHSENVRYSLPRRKPEGRAVLAAAPGGYGLYFPSQSAAEFTLLGKLTGSVSMAIKTGRPSLGYEWCRV